MSRMRLGEMLVRAGLLEPDALRAVLTWQTRAGGRLGDLLLHARLVSPGPLYQVLGQQLGVPFEQVSTLKVPPPLLRMFPTGLLVHHRVLPIRFAIAPRRGLVVVATSDPLNRELLADLRTACGFEVRFVIASPHDVELGLVTNGLLKQPREIELPADDGQELVIERALV